MHTSYFVYILECNDKTYYIGKTNDLSKRLAIHNGIGAGGAKYTRSRRPVFLIYYEIYDNLSEALRREISLKKLTKGEKRRLIFSNPIA